MVFFRQASLNPYKKRKKGCLPVCSFIKQLGWTFTAPQKCFTVCWSFAPEIKAEQPSVSLSLHFWREPRCAKLWGRGAGQFLTWCKRKLSCMFDLEKNILLKKQSNMWHCNIFIYKAPFDPNTCSRAFSHQSGLNIYHGGKMTHGKNLYYLINFTWCCLLFEQLYSILYACFSLILLVPPHPPQNRKQQFILWKHKISYRLRKKEISPVSESPRLTAFFLAWLFCQLSFAPAADDTENQVQSHEMLRAAFPATPAELFHQE